MPMVNLKINDREVQAEAGSTILEAAQSIGIDIPTLCYHPALKPEGACRICLVEVAKQRVLQPACSFPVSEGMEVWTDSERVIRARRFVLELLLSDHPLDCLTCEQNGNCVLQDLAYKYEIKDTEFRGEMHHYPIDDANPFIERDYNKCILCRRCVRACQELQIRDAIGIINRGFTSKVGTAFDGDLKESPCVFCGLCIAVCPVGALTEKRAVGKGRVWELKKITTTCSYCGVGCSFDLNVKDNKIVKVTSNWDAPANKGFLCVKGRFGWDFVHSPDRLTEPLIKKEGEFVEASWDEALDLVASKFNEIKEKEGSDAFGVFTSAKCTNEENYLVQKFSRAVIGTNNIDHCAHL